MATAWLQEVPSNAEAREPLSPATQSPGDAHDTDARPPRLFGSGSSIPGAARHVPPLNTNADESSASTAMQKLAVGQDTESGWPAADDSAAGWLQVVPSYLAA